MRTSRVVLGAAAAFLAVAAAPPVWALQGPKPGAASPQKLKVPDKPGSISGLSDAATVNVFSGQVAYSVPLDLPNGAGGFGPQLALTYSGDLGNGSMGIGWTLGQISIRRTTRYGVPSYTDADELELVGIGAGGRLIPHGDGKTFWVLGQAKTLRVTKVGSRFEVKDGDGATYILGSSIRARETDGEKKVSGWLVESVTNVVGQQIRFTYERDQGQTYLDSIEWGPGAVRYRLETEYLGRKDVAISYRTGYEVRTARLLRRLVLEVIEGAQTEVAKTFTLGYDETFAASRLRTIELTGTPRDAPAKPAQSLPVLTFEYARAVHGAKVPLGGLDGWQLNERGVSLLDVDGDGMSDLVRMEAGNHQYRKNQGGKFSDAVSMSGASDVELEVAQLMDLDGDARPELVRIVDDTWRVYSLENGSWHPLGSWPGSSGVPLHGKDMALADLNGDGRTDVIEGAAGALRVTFNTKNGLAPTVRLPQISAAEAVIEPGNANVRFADFNGDGLADVEYLTDAWIKVFLGRGDGTFVVWQRVYWPWGEAAFDTNDIHIADLDRDGLMDVVRFSAGNVSWYPGLPNGHFAEASAVRHLDRPENAAADAVVAIADVLGQGSQDVVWSSPRGMWALDLAGPTTAGMLTKIDNGMGKATRFSYKSSAILAVEAENQGEPWDVKLPTVVPMPVRTETDLGDDALLRVAHFGVRDGFWDGKERRFGGFLGASEQHPTAAGIDATLVTTTRFHAGLEAERVLRGLAWTVRRSDGRGRVIDVAKTDWQVRAISDMPDDPGTRRATKTRDSGEFYEGATVPFRTETRYDDFDALGRARMETHLGLIDVPGDERVVRRRFADGDSPWVRERVFEEVVSEMDGTIVKGTRTLFGGPSGLAAALGSAGAGFVRETDGYSTSSAWPPQTTTVYDSFGNPVELYADGVSRTISYDSNLFPNSETVRTVGMSTLSWNMTWDHVLGAASVLTDPNLDFTTVAYDTLGRPTGVSQNGGGAHMCFAYTWNAPANATIWHPKTSTWVFDGKLSELPSAPCPAGPPAGGSWRQTIAVNNGAGESLYASTPLGDGTWIVSGWKELDDRGHVSLMAEAFSAVTSEPAAFVGGTRHQTFVYDAQSRLRRQTLPNGATKEISYESAFKQTVTAPELAPVESTFDGQRRVVFTRRVVNGEAESVSARYDAADRIVAMTLQDGTAHTFGYDPLGRLVEAHDPDTGQRTLEYDFRNFLVRHTNGELQDVYFEYDLAGRLTRRGESVGLAPATDYIFKYDDDATAYEPSGCRTKSRLASVLEPSGVVGVPTPTGEAAFCYDVFGRQTKSRRTIVAAGGARTATQMTELSPSGFSLTEAFDDGFETATDYDRAGRAVAIRSGGSVLWQAIELEPTGRVRKESYGNGVTQLYEYDALGLAKDVEVKPPGQAPDLFKIAVTRNTYGAPTLVHDDDLAGLNHEATYEYDPAARLTRATLGAEGDQGGGQYEFKFAYDALQNMKLRTVAQHATGQPAVTKDIGVLMGTYKYAERGYGPRQLTSVIPGTP